MAKPSSSNPGPNGPKSTSVLLERVRARVTQVGAAIAGDAPWADREASSMRRVFRQMGRSYRLHRRQTGDHVNPAVRDAALAFKGDPTLASLTEVAARLEQEGVVNW